MANTLPTIISLKRKLNLYIQAEKYHAKLTCTMNQFDKKWNKFTAILQEGNQPGGN